MTYPYIPGSPRHQSGPNGPITRIVIHATCSGTHAGGARQNAAYFQQDTAGGLAHYVVDPSEVVQCCHEDIACWHAPPNQGSIGIELCDPQTGAASRWQSPEDEAMLRLAAKLVVEIASRHGVPLMRLSSADVRAGRHGICGHVNVSEAFGQSSHTDPGPDFPWAHFMDLIHGHVQGSAAANPTMVEEDMIFVRRKGGKGVYLTNRLTRRGIATNAELQLWIASGIPAHIYEIPQDVFDRIKEQT